MARKAATKAAEPTTGPSMNIPDANIQRIKVGITGIMPMITHRFDQKAKEMIMLKHLNRAIPGRKAKDPVSDFEACIHWLRTPSGEQFCAMPGGSFKDAMIGAIRQLKGQLHMVTVKQVVHVLPHMVRIYGDQPVMCEHVVRNETGVIDIRHRAIYLRWSAELPIEFDADCISAEMITALLNRAGFGCGIGDWRPSAPKSNNGQMGRFRVATQHDLVGLEHTKYCAENPFDLGEAEMYGVVMPDRLQFYIDCAAANLKAPAEPMEDEKPKKGRKTTKKAPANLEEAGELLESIEGARAASTNGTVLSGK